MAKFCRKEFKIRTFMVIAACLVSLYGTVMVRLYAAAISNQTIIALTNKERADQSLPPLIWSGALASSAWLKAQDMCTKDYWAHTAPDGSTGWTFMQQSGYEYITAGENLAKNFVDDVGVVEGWMASPGHRAAILNADYVDAGIATISCVQGGVPTTLVVAHYGATVARNIPAEPPTATTQVMPAKQIPKPNMYSQTLYTKPEPLEKVRVATAEAETGEAFGVTLWKLSRIYPTETVFRLF